MMRRKPSRTLKPKPLAQQETDFTAEGAPPPGKVATSAPVAPGKARKPRSRATAAKHGARKGPPQGRYG